MTWHWNHIEYEQEPLQHLQEYLGIDPALVCRLLSLGITTIDEAKSFFRPDLTHLHNPFLLRDMEKATNRLLQAIEQEEQILLFGDYDADGVCGVTLLYRFLYRLCKRKPIFYMPDRIHEGYGLNSQGIAFGVSHHATLLILIDLGSNQKTYVAEAKAAGLDTIICDHHPINHIEQAAEPYALINPMQPHCTYPNKYLSGCAVAFQLARAVAQRKFIPDSKVMQLVDLVAISLATDILPLTHENRILASLGIQQLSATEHIGMVALQHKLSKQKPYSISDIVYGLGPLLNAPGRMSNASEAVKMLISTDLQEADILAQRLASLNVQRRHFDEKQSKQANTLIKEIELKPKTPLVLYKEDWSAGVSGITSGRLADQLNTPVIVFAKHNDRQYIGSARSIQGIDLAIILHACAHLIDEWGGHAHAAGLKIRANKLEEFRVAFTAQIQKHWPEEPHLPTLNVVSELPFNRINTKFLRILAQFAPFGPENRSPVFYAKGIVKHGMTEAITSRHIKLRLACTETGVVLPALIFHRLELFKTLPPNQKMKIAFTIHDTSFTKGHGIMLQLKDFHLEGE
jgi:single-stranded-DNA-specific exonuclease